MHRIPFYLLVFLGLILNSAAQSKQQKFTQEEVIADVDYLYKSLQEAHHNLYAYTSKEKLDSVYTALKAAIPNDSLNLLEATTLLQRLPAAVNNGHTSIEFPGQSYGQYAYAGGTVFPLEIAFEYNTALVRKNWSDNDSIPIGAEVLRINRLSISDILSKMYPQISAERQYFKNAKIELYSFPRYYWQIFGQKDEFEVEISVEGTIKKYSLSAVDVIEGYEAKRTEVIQSKMELEFLPTAAHLTPGGFGGDEEQYRHFIDSAFVEINAKKPANLIIDLRNNPGGDDAFSDYLVSYFADKPFKWNSKFTLKTSKLLKEHVRQHNDTTRAFWRDVLTYKNGEIYDYVFDAYIPQPKEKRFEGNVYVLINRQSHSQSAVTAAQIQDYNFGIIVGEETGEYPSLYASIFQYTLPNTGITVNISKGHIVRVNGSTKEEGVLPDIFIKDRLLDEHDEILTGLLERLR